MADQAPREKSVEAPPDAKNHPPLTERIEDPVEAQIRDLQPTLFQKLRMKLMSPEEKEAFILELAEKKARKAEAIKDSGK